MAEAELASSLSMVNNPLQAAPTTRRAIHENKSLAESIAARENSLRNSLVRSPPSAMFPTDDIEEIRDHYEKVDILSMFSIFDLITVSRLLLLR